MEHISINIPNMIVRKYIELGIYWNILPVLVFLQKCDTSIEMTNQITIWAVAIGPNNIGP